MAELYLEQAYSKTRIAQLKRLIKRNRGVFRDYLYQQLEAELDRLDRVNIRVSKQTMGAWV